MSKRLLLADDSITIQKVIGITFANEDYQLDIVDNGTSALEHARAHRPDAVLADVYMPGKNGYELCTAIKQDPQLQGVPVLLLAGTFEPFDEDKATQAGADGWIIKPFESQALIDRVEELIRSGSQSQQTAVPAAGAGSAGMPAASAGGLEAADEDLWAEPEAPGPVEEVDLADDLEPLGEETASAGQDDIWGSVSFDEEDLVEDVAVASAPSVKPAGPAPAQAAAGKAAGEVWDDEIEEVDEIFDLESEDIVDEADLLEDFSAPVEAPVVAADVEEDVFSAEDEEPLEIDREPAPAGKASKVAVTPAWLEEYEIPADDEETEMELDTPDFSEAEEMAFEEPEAAVPVEPVAAVQPPPAATVRQPQPAVPASVTLDEAEVERIVARVAEEVIERLAGTLLEKIAWEVVPDLAEGMIKDEIRRIKASIQ